MGDAKIIARLSSADPTVSVYIDGAFEHLYQVDPSSGVRSYEHYEIHVMDDRIRIAQIRTGTPFPSDSSPAVRYFLEDHLGNSSFTLSNTGTIISREEYFPFGETSFGSFAKKRYRFCGKERDEESGLYYYGARPAAAGAAWTCRFVSVDPLAGDYPFYTPYQYAGNQPIIAIDLDGLCPWIPWKKKGSISTNSDTGAISGTVYVKWDRDATSNPAQRDAYITSLSQSMNQFANGETFKGNAVTTNIQVVSLADGERAPKGANVFTVGNGASARSDSRNSQISYTKKGGKTGYLYFSRGGQDGEHELGHWLGLADRYTEALHVQPLTTNNGGNWPITNQRQTIPLAIQRSKDDRNNYQPNDNLMSTGHDLTNSQLKKVFGLFGERKFQNALVLYSNSRPAIVDVNNFLIFKTVRSFVSNTKPERGTNGKSVHLSWVRGFPVATTLLKAGIFFKHGKEAHNSLKRFNITFTFNDWKVSYRENKRIVIDGLKRL